LVWVPLGAWLANLVLFPLGLFLMQRARHDSRLFDGDVYPDCLGAVAKS
jgi:lipopolysaccharide export system permease protein